MRAEQIPDWLQPSSKIIYISSESLEPTLVRAFVERARFEAGGDQIVVQVSGKQGWLYASSMFPDTHRANELLNNIIKLRVLAKQISDQAQAQMFQALNARSRGELR